MLSGSRWSRSHPPQHSCCSALSPPMLSRSASRPAQPLKSKAAAPAQVQPLERVKPADAVRQGSQAPAAAEVELAKASQAADAVGEMVQASADADVQAREAAQAADAVRQAGQDPAPSVRTISTSDTLSAHYVEQHSSVHPRWLTRKAYYGLTASLEKIFKVSRLSTMPGSTVYE